MMPRYQYNPVRVEVREAQGDARPFRFLSLSSNTDDLRYAWFGKVVSVYV